MTRGRYHNPPPPRSTGPTPPLEIIDVPRKTPLPPGTKFLRWNDDGILELDPTQPPVPRDPADSAGTDAP